MDFTFDDQQLAFRDAIRKFLMVEAAPEMLRETWETTESGRSATLRAKLAEQGITTLSVPQEFGGLGLGDLDWVLVHQELGYFAIPDSLVDSAYLGVELLKGLPPESRLKHEWLPRIATGAARIAISHPINPLVADAKNSDLLLLWNEDEVHAVHPDQVQCRLNRSIDVSRRLYEVDWTPSPASRICGAACGRRLWARAVERASLAIAAQLVGLAQRMLDLGVDHAGQRKQFGKPIGSFQAVKHHLADVAVRIEFAEPVVHRAAYALAHDDSRAPRQVSQARLVAAEAALLAARKSLQVHGAMGYTWEADLQMFMKRAWALHAAWGDSMFHKARLMAFLLDDAAVLAPGAVFS